MDDPQALDHLSSRLYIKVRDRVSSGSLYVTPMLANIQEYNISHWYGDRSINARFW